MLLLLNIMLNTKAWGYVPSKGLKDLILRILGHPHPNGRIRARIAMDLIDNKKTLDVGCGEGIFCFELKKRGYDVTGIDLSQDALNHARENFNKLNLDINVSKSSTDKLPFKSNTFEQVICLDVLEHVKDVNKSLKEINKVLVDGGNLIITVPNERYLSKPIIPYDYSKILKMMGHDHKGFDLPEIRILLNKNGFRVVSYQYYHKFFSRITSEILFALMGKNRFRKSRKNMYKRSFLALLSFVVIYPINMLDYFLPRKSKGCFLAIKALKV